MAVASASCLNNLVIQAGSALVKRELIGLHTTHSLVHKILCIAGITSHFHNLLFPIQCQINKDYIFMLILCIKNVDRNSLRSG